jgi:branched-chain amino acid transport system substrate-binding protein
MSGSSVFICYRRDDSTLYARNLYAELQRHFGERKVFMDVRLALGANFVEQVERQIAACGVLLVVIGPDWSTIADPDGNRRLDDPEDLVRREIEAGLARDNVVVIPLFVRGAQMPKLDELPPSLAPLRSRNGLALVDHRWDEDMSVIVTRLRAKLDPTGAPPLAPQPAPPPPDAPSIDAGPPRQARPAVVAVLSRLRSRRSRLFAGLALSLGLLVIVAVLLASGTGQDNVRIGAIYTQSGDGKSAGIESLNGVKLAVDYIKDASYPDLGLSLLPGAGLPELHGAKLEVKDVDVAHDRCRAQPAFSKLVKEDGVVAVIGAYESTVTQQAIVAANRLRIPLVNDTATASGLTSPKDDSKRQRPCGEWQEDPTPSEWFSRVGGNDDQFAKTFQKLIEHEHERDQPIRRVAVIFEGHDSFGSSGFAATRKLAYRLHLPRPKGFKYVNKKLHDKARATKGCSRHRLVEDLRELVRKIKKFQPDIVFALSYLEDATLVWQTMADLKYRPPAMLVYGAGYADPKFIDKARKGTRGCGLSSADPTGIITRSSGGWPKDGGDPNRVAKIFERRFHQKMTDTTARAFTATIALATAINNAHSTDPDRIRKALRGLKIPARETILPGDGGIRFDQQGQNTRVKVILQQIHDRSYSTVYPLRRTNPPVWPLLSLG